MEKIKCNYRVVVEPRTFSGSINRKTLSEEQLSICETMIDQIKRHVDDVRDIEIVNDTIYRCEHCGYEFADDGKDKWDCCDKAIAEWESHIKELNDE